MNYKAGFSIGGILRAEQNVSLSVRISFTREITRQRKILPTRKIPPAGA
jgi:hypothetical protein